MLHLTNTHRNSLSADVFLKQVRKESYFIHIPLHIQTHTHTYAHTHAGSLHPHHIHIRKLLKWRSQSAKRLLHTFLYTLRERSRNNTTLSLSLSLTRRRVSWENAERKEPLFIHTSTHARAHTRKHIPTHTYTQTHTRARTHTHTEVRCEKLDVIRMPLVSTHVEVCVWECVHGDMREDSACLNV